MVFFILKERGLIEKDPLVKGKAVEIIGWKSFCHWIKARDDDVMGMSPDLSTIWPAPIWIASRP
jgi:hypothetical protein